MTSKSIGIDGDATLVGIADSGTPASGAAVSRRLLLKAAAAGSLVAAGGAAFPVEAVASGGHSAGRALWQIARHRGLVFGSSAATWQLFEDPPRDLRLTEYAPLHAREAEIVFTEDDLLWYKVKPTPDSPLDFTYADLLYGFARRHRQLVLAAHLVWDEGFGEGWPEDYLWELDKPDSEELLFGTARAMLRRYRGRTAGWIVANEVTSPIGDGGDELGFRTEVPWYQTIGREYVRRMFRLARRHDPHATLVLNEFGFETTNEFGDDPVARQEGFLSVIDTLQRQHVPLDAVGIQAHLLAAHWDSFDPKQYRKFLKRISDRGLKILITEMDVLDDGLPAAVRPRDRAVANIYADYLDTTLANPAVKSLITFGLSDRYTWLQEDYPREDGAARRPLPYDEDLHPKPALRALRRELRTAPRRRPLWGSRRR
jgi:endo-1,4-beta-xylanase